MLGADISTKISVHGDGSKTNVLFLGDGGVGEKSFVNSSPNAHAAQVACTTWTDGIGATPTPDIGVADPSWLREMLAPLREAHPLPLTDIRPGVTDFRVYRVNATNCTIGIHLNAAK